MMTFMLRKTALLLGVFGVGAWLMYSAQNGNYERQDLLKGIALWSLIGSFGLYICSTGLLKFHSRTVDMDRTKDDNE